MLNTAILIINGDVNAKFIEQHLKTLKLEPTIYCIDGAFNKVKTSKYIVSHTQAVIGDLDSIDQSGFQDQFKGIQIIESIDQDYTDFSKALSYLSQDYNKIIVFGMGGGEMDHCLGNISTVLSWYQKLEIEFIDEYSRYFITNKNIILNNVLGKMISVVPLFTAQDITYSGLKYILKGETLDFMTRIGTRNYAINDTINIKFSMGILMVFISHELYLSYLEEVKLKESNYE